MNNQTFDSVIKNPRTNWKYILIVVILSVIVGGAVWQYEREIKSLKGPLPLPLLEKEPSRKKLDLVQEWRGELDIEEEEIIEQIETGDLDGDEKLELVVMTRAEVAKKQKVRDRVFVYLFEFKDGKFVRQWDMKIKDVGGADPIVSLALGDLYHEGKININLSQEFNDYTIIKSFSWDGQNCVLQKTKRFGVLINRIAVSDINDDGMDELIIAKHSRYHYPPMSHSPIKSIISWLLGIQTLDAGIFPVAEYRIEVLSWNGEDFLSIWEGPESTLVWGEVVRGGDNGINIWDLNNNGLKEISGVYSINFEFDGENFKETERLKVCSDLDQASYPEGKESGKPFEFFNIDPYSYSVGDYNNDGRQEVICNFKKSKGVLGSKVGETFSLYNISEYSGFLVLGWNENKNIFEEILRQEFAFKLMPTFKPTLADIDNDGVKEILMPRGWERGIKGSEKELFIFGFVDF